MIFRFAHPAAFLLLIIPVILAVLHFRRDRRIDFPVIRYSDVRLIAGLPIGWRVRLYRLPDILRVIAWILLVIALARPQGGQAQQVIRGQGVDIVLALDVSGSMSALDFAPQNRLEAAKTVINSFIAGREFDRIGLVVFARDAFQQVPPTLDYRTLVRSLDSLRLATDYGLDDGTAIGLGIASAGNMLRTSDAASRIIILLTDGANNAGGVGPITAAEAVAALGMRVYTIGIGKSGLVPVPIDDAGNTQLIESDLDEPTLRAIGQVTNGQYFRADDLVDLESVYEQIDRLERSEVQQQVFVRWQEQATLLMIMGLVFLLVERLLRHTVFQSIP
jgi:Ca-activated chloride channel family protein